MLAAALCLTLLLTLLAAPALSVVSTASAASSPRLAARSALLRSLEPNSPPRLLNAEHMALIGQLEAAGTTPTTEDFLQLGLQGRWALCATIRNAGLLEPGMSPAHAAASGAGGAAGGLLPIGIARAETALSIGNSTVRSRAWFQLLDGERKQVGALLDVESRFAFESDSVTGARLLALRPARPPRLALKTNDLGCSIDALVEALHAQLSPEFALVEGEQYDRLRLSTTYLDESLWVARAAPHCCSVFYRADGEMAWLSGDQ